MQPPPTLDSLNLEAVDATTLRALGKERFIKGDYHGALEAYDRWLELEPGSSMAYSNKSASFMALKQWEKTYLAARKAQELDPSNTKAAYHRGVALMRMRCYAGAVSILEAATAGDPSQASIARAFEEAKVLAKQATGEFDPEVLYSGKAKNVIADYVGPIEVFESSRGTDGRGLRLTRDVKPGELLLVENPLVSVMGTLPCTPSADVIIRNKALQQLSDRWLESSLDCRRMNALAVDSQQPKEQRPLPSIHTFAQFYSEAELFAVLNQEESKSLEPRKEGEEKLLQISFIESASDAQLDDDAVFQKSSTTQSSGSGTTTSSWVISPMINHSCIPNVTRVTLKGGIAVLRASRHLHAGQELFLDLINVSQPLQNRRAAASAEGFNTCTCERCMFEENLPVRIKEQMAHIAKLTDLNSGRLATQIMKAKDGPSPQHRIQTNQKCWDELFPLVEKLEGDLKAAGINDEQMQWCSISITNAYSLLVSNSLFRVSTNHLLPMELEAKRVHAEHITSPGGISERDCAVRLAYAYKKIAGSTLAVKFGPSGWTVSEGGPHLVEEYQKKVGGITAAKAKKMLFRAIKTRYGCDLTASQVKHIEEVVGKEL